MQVNPQAPKARDGTSPDESGGQVGAGQPSRPCTSSVTSSTESDPKDSRLQKNHT